MAINKKLIHFKNKLKFEEELAKGNILDSSIVFILDTTEIYTRGLLYNGSTFDPSDIEASILNLLNNKVDKVSGKSLSTNDYTTTEKNKLAGIASGAEVNVQSDWNITNTNSDAYIKNKPSLSTVATSGSYNDLSNKPSIDSALSTTSTNSVLNKAITIGINAKYTKPSTGIPKSDLASSILTSLGKADTALLSIPSEYITETELAAKGYTTNIGTITGIKMNGASKGTSGVVDLGTVITSHQDISGKLDKTTAASTYLTKTDAATTYLGISAKAANATKADSATRATQDANGNVITSTYATKTSVNKIQTQIDTLVGDDANTAIESFNEIIAFLEGVEDTETLDGIIAGINTEIAKKADKSSAITNITRSGTTFTATRADGTTFKFNLQDNNTTYTFSGGINKFTVTPSGGSAQTVLVTPSIANNITGSGTSGYLAKFNGANTVTNGPALGSSTSTYLRNDGTWATPPNSNTIPSAYCSTAAGTAAKAASCSGYVLTANTYLHLNLTAANSAKSALTLNVNSTGAKNIYINGFASSSSNYTLPAGTYVVFYDGTQFQLRTDGVLPGKILAAKNADTVNGLTVLTAVPANAKFTDNNTTYSAGKGLTLNSTTFNVGAGTGISVADDTVGLATSGVTAGTYGDDEATRTLTHSDVFDVPQITVDAYGRITSASTKTLTLPASGNTDTKVTSVGNHYTPKENTDAAISASADSATNVTGSGAAVNVVTGLKRDAAGHVVGVTSAKIYSTDNNTTQFTITASASDDDVVVLSGTNGTNKVTYSASHAKKFSTSGSTYTSGNTTTSISGSGGSGTIKVPQITVDSYGHVTAAADESVTITMPSVPVTSVAGKTGAVKLAKGDVGLGNVTNESKATMFTNAALTGTPTAPTQSAGNNSTRIATTAFVQSAIDAKLAANDAMIFKGTIGATSGKSYTVTSLPSTHNAGWTYKVAEAGTYAGAKCEIGDMIICITDGKSANDAHWTVVQNNIDGAVTGPSSSTDARVAVFNGTTGKVIKDSGFTIAKSVPRDAKFTDTNTHYTSKNIVGASSTATANATASNGSVYLNHLEESTVKSAHLIKGTGATTVTSDSSGNITINSTDTNTWRSISDSVTSTSSDVSASSKAVKTAYDLAASKTSNTGTVTSVTPGTGLTGTSSDAAITSTGTINLKSAATGEIGGIKVGTVNSSAVTTKTEGSNYYPVNIDSNSKAYVALPTWSNNSGTITGIKMNGSSKGTSGVVDLGTVITSHQDISGKADKSSLATVATSGSYNDLKNKPTIPSAVSETTVSGWGFTKNTGTYTKPSTGIPVSDLTSAIQISLDKADTALQSIPSEYVTETELVNKGYATASELNTKLALKANKTDLPTKVSNLTNDSNFASATDRGIDVGGLNVMDARLGSDRVYFASHAQATYLSDGRDVETAVNSIETIASEASVISSEAKVNAAAAVASVSTLSGLANATTAMETLAGQVTQIQLNKESIVDIYATIDGYDTTEIFYGTCNAINNTKTYTKIMSNVTEVGPCKIIAETNLRYTGKGNNTFVGLFYLPTGTDDLKGANTVISIDGGATGVLTPAGTLLIEYPGSGPINQPVDIYVGSRFSGTVKVVFDGEQVEGLTDKVNDNTTAIRQHENRLTDLGSDVSLVSSGVQALKNDVEELQQLIVGENGDNNLQTIYVNGKGSTSKTWDLLLSNVTQTPPIIITAETDIVYTGSSGSTFLSLDSAPAGTSTQPSSLITPISGTAGQVIAKGTEIFNYAGQSLPEAKDVYIGVRYSGTLKIVIREEKEVVLGLSDQVKKNTADIANNSARITALESNPSASTSDIISLYQDQILRARQLGYRSSKSESIYPVKPLVFMHISDTHTSKPNTRAIQILNYLGANGNVKFLMHTGDMLEDPKRNPPAWSSIVSAAQYPVFVTSGNHDVGNWATATSQYRTDDQFYAAFITPQINSWGLKTDGGGTPHPSGKNYYFTDFTEEKIRFIVVYEYEIPSVSTQTDAGRGARWISQDLTNWFINTLLTTPAGYGVIVAKHAPDGLIGDDRNPFNSFYKDGENTQQSYQYRDGAAYTAFFADIVQAFMDKKSIKYTVTQSAASYQGTVNVSANFSSVASGVEFICYVSGHVHADNISFLQTHPKQLELNINCDNTIVSNQRSETLLIEGTRFEDAINVYSIDRNYGKIHVLRIGADYDAYGNRKDLMTINYRQ